MGIVAHALAPPSDGFSHAQTIKIYIALMAPCLTCGVHAQVWLKQSTPWSLVPLAIFIYQMIDVFCLVYVVKNTL